MDAAAGPDARVLTALRGACSPGRSGRRSRFLGRRQRLRSYPRRPLRNKVSCFGESSNMILADGDWRYEAVSDWAKIPAEVRLGDVAAVAVDRRNNVYLFTRGDDPVIVLDRHGNVLRTWGHGMFVHPHGLHIGPDESIYCTDDGDHSVRKCTLDGRLVLEIGIPGQPAPFMSGRPFHRCTHSALSPQGDIYVSDGYGNACIHKFAPDGRYLLTWGQSGSGPGEFYVPHNLVCDMEGWVYVADRENHRVQVFDTYGRYE